MLDEESSYKCGLLIEYGVYQMIRLPSGLKNAAGYFARTITEILMGSADCVI
jgi:hypothetical protein